MASIYGKVIYADGTKASNEIRISNSWNGTIAFPRNGFYLLELGGTPQRPVTIYVNGEAYATIFVGGDLDLMLIV